MLTPELKQFGAGLAPLGYGETDLAASLTWYLCQVAEQEEVSASTLATLMHDLGLKGPQVNVSRLAKRLAQHADLIRGKTPNTFRIRLSQLDRLTKKHEPLLARPKPRIEQHVLVMDDFATARKYLVAMAEQVNGCYQFGFYDGCAVMCRRLMETLLIEAFEHKGVGDKIKAADGEYVGLADIIARAKGGQYMKLQRGSADVMEDIKQRGDTAAHSRTYITKQTDIDQIRFKYRKIISELMHLAGII